MPTRRTTSLRDLGELLAGNRVDTQTYADALRELDDPVRPNDAPNRTPANPAVRELLRAATAPMETIEEHLDGRIGEISEEKFAALLDDAGRAMRELRSRAENPWGILHDAWKRKTK